MKSGILVAAAAAAGLMATTAMASAHETRMGDAALGATAGMLVAGPVGLVAGGAIALHGWTPYFAPYFPRSPPLPALSPAL